MKTDCDWSIELSIFICLMWRSEKSKTKYSTKSLIASLQIWKLLQSLISFLQFWKLLPILWFHLYSFANCYKVFDFISTVLKTSIKLWFHLYSFENFYKSLVSSLQFWKLLQSFGFISTVLKTSTKLRFHLHKSENEQPSTGI